MQLIARAPDTGRSSSHLSSPRTARVAKAESSRGGGKRTGLSASHAATTTPCLALRFQTGSRTSGVDAHRVHALQGCECREKTHRFKCDPVEVMATVLSRPRPTCCWSKTAVAKEPRARRLGDPHAVPKDGLGAHDEGRGCPRMCMHNEQGHRPKVPLEGTAITHGHFAGACEQGFTFGRLVRTRRVPGWVALSQASDQRWIGRIFSSWRRSVLRVR